MWEACREGPRNQPLRTGQSRSRHGQRALELKWPTELPCLRPKWQGLYISASVSHRVAACGPGKAALRR